jgi:twin BRCT domain-containing protein
VLAPPATLPRLSEGQESEIVAESEMEVQPLPLSEVLNIEFTPEASPHLREPPSILKGVTFYVDIWDSNGVRADQYFVPLLEDLGAKVVDEFTHDVTHVLFKDGEEKTLRRVAGSNGSVKCVNVGWALE